MPPEKRKSIKEIAVLTRSIEYLVKNLVKVMVGKITLTRFQQLVEENFIEAAENQLRKQRPGRDVPLTSLALVTGLDTRQLSRIRNSETYRKPKHQEQEFVSSLTAESCIVDLWTSSPMFTDPKTGEPKKLSIWGPDTSFETAVREAIRARGITVTSALERMRQSNMVTVHEDDTVELNLKSLAPKSARDRIGSTKLGLDAVGQLLDTIDHNLESGEEETSKRYQRGYWTHRLDPDRRQELERRMRALLEKTEAQAIDVLREFEEDSADETQIDAGFGLYYFEAERH